MTRTKDGTYDLITMVLSIITDVRPLLSIANAIGL